MGKGCEKLQLMRGFMEKEYEIIIVGGGPAGISAGIYAHRAGAKTLVFDSGVSNLERTKVLQNYYGFESISGKELKEKGIKQFKGLGGEVEKAEILKITKDFSKNCFFVKTEYGEYSSKVVILCTGSGKKKTVDGLEKYEGENVSYCAVCDGFFYRGKTVAVIGSGKFALSEAEELSKIAKKVYLISNNDEKTNKIAKNIEKISKKIKEFVGKNRIEKIIFEDNSSVDVSGVFVALGSLSTLEMAKQLGLLTKNNTILVDENYMTNVAGVFAAGDCIGGLLQVAKAVSDGAMAGLMAVRYIKMLEEKNDKA